MKVCFDVNTLIYLFAEGEKQAEVLFAYDVGTVRRFSLCIPACSLSDIHYILHRNGLSGRRLRDAMDSLFTLFEVFDANGSDGVQALGNEMGDFEDAMIAESASRNDVDVILTYNAKDFRNSPIPAMTPDAFVEAFKPSNVTYAELVAN